MNANSKPALSIISAEQETTIRAALHMLHSAMVNYGATQLPAFDECGEEEYKRLFQRGLTALQKLQEHRREQAIAHLRQGVRDTLKPHVEAHHAEKAEYDRTFASIPQAMRSHIRAFDPTIQVPMSDFAHIFPEGTDVAKQASTLKMMGYTVGKGTNGFYVRVAL